MEGNPISKFDPFGLLSMCHRPIQGYVIPGRHCFVQYNDGGTDSFTPTGVGNDLAPNGAQCTAASSTEEDEDCVKREMKKCSGYHFTKNNCCHCVENALKACGYSVPGNSWPNWPINPGPGTGSPQSGGGQSDKK